MIKYPKNVNTMRGFYRLGDLVILGNSSISDIMMREGKEKTIGYKYITHATSNNTYWNFEYLNELIDDYISQEDLELAGESELVVHLRMGDVLRITEDELGSVINAIKSAYTESNSRSIVIVTAYHMPITRKTTHNERDFKVMKVMIDDSNYVLDKLLHQLNIYGIPVTLRSGDIDSDFCYLCRAKNLLITRGRFSLLAGVCNPNNVYTVWDSRISIDNLHMIRKSSVVRFEYAGEHYDGSELDKVLNERLNSCNVR
jgi:hypothetical protein